MSTISKLKTAAFTFFMSGQILAAPLTQLAPQMTAIDYYQVGNQELSLSSQNLMNKIIGNSSLVALGESMHNLSEPSLIRIPILNYLNKHKGFKTVVAETGMVRALKVEAFIQSEIPTHWSAADYEAKLKAVVKEGLTHSMGDYAEMVELIRYMHTYNQGRASGKLHFIGVDLPVYGDSIHKVTHELAQEFKVIAGGLQDQKLKEAFRQLEELGKISGFFYQLVERASHGHVDPDYLDDVTSFGFELLSSQEKKQLKDNQRILSFRLRLLRQMNPQLKWEKIEVLSRLFKQIIRDLEIRDVEQALPNRNYFAKALMKKTRTLSTQAMATALSRQLKSLGIDMLRGKREKMLVDIFATRNSMQSGLPVKDEKKCKALLKKGEISSMDTCGVYDQDWTAYFAARFDGRENHLVDNLRIQINNNNKALFLAHNGHVQKTAIEGVKGAGTILTKLEGENYKVIGVTNDIFTVGHLNRYKELDQIFGAKIINSEEVKSSFEYQVKKYTEVSFNNPYESVYLIDSDQVWLSREVPFRWNHDFKAINIKDSFDAVLYFPSSELGIKAK